MQLLDILRLQRCCRTVSRVSSLVAPYLSCRLVLLPRMQIPFPS